MAQRLQIWQDRQHEQCHTNPTRNLVCASDRRRYSARGDEANERVRIWRLEWPQDDGIHNGEDRGIGPNTERQRQD